MEMLVNRPNAWEEALERFMEGLCPASELSSLLLRIDLPEEGREAIRDALSLVDGLNQSLRPLPVPAGGLTRVLGKLRLRPEPADKSVGHSEGMAFEPVAGDGDESAELFLGVSEQERKEAAEFRALVRGLDQALAVLPIPQGAGERLWRAVVAEEDRDVSAAIHAGIPAAGLAGVTGDSPDPAHEEDSSADVVVRIAHYFHTHGHERDVLAAQKEEVAPSDPPGQAGGTDPAADKPQ